MFANQRGSYDQLAAYIKTPVVNTSAAHVGRAAPLHRHWLAPRMTTSQAAFDRANLLAGDSGDRRRRFSPPPR